MHEPRGEPSAAAERSCPARGSYSQQHTRFHFKDAQKKHRFESWRLGAKNATGQVTRPPEDLLSSKLTPDKINSTG